MISFGVQVSDTGSFKQLQTTTFVVNSSSSGEIVVGETLSNLRMLLSSVAPTSTMTLNALSTLSTSVLVTNANSSSGSVWNETDPDTDDTRPFVPSTWVQLMWTILFSVMVLSAVIGNLLVIWIILRHKMMRTKVNIFLLNLSFADLTMALFNAMFNFVYMLKSHWPFGDTYCTFSNYVANFAIGLSVFTITATSIDRYMVVVHPLNPRTSKRTSALILLGIWCFSALLALPTFIYSVTITFEYSEGEERTLCTLQWPDGLSGASKYDYIYNVLFFVLTYAIPMLSMSVTYTIMARSLWGNTYIGEMTRGQRDALKSKQKVVPMLIAVTVIFGLCWLPYHLYFLYIYHNLEISADPLVQHLYLGFYWLAMSNSTFNPLIYGLLNKRFQNYFKCVLFCREYEEIGHRARYGRKGMSNNTENIEIDLHSVRNPKSNAAIQTANESL